MPNPKPARAKAGKVEYCVHAGDIPCPSPRYCHLFCPCPKCDNIPEDWAEMVRERRKRK